MSDPQPLTLRKCNLCGGSGGTMRGMCNVCRGTGYVGATVRKPKPKPITLFPKDKTDV